MATIWVSNHFEFQHAANTSTPTSNPLEFGWVTKQNKLNQNKHADGTETISCLAYPATSATNALKVTVATEQAESPGGSERPEPPWPT